MPWWVNCQEYLATPCDLPDALEEGEKLSYFSTSDLKNATNNFDTSTIIGKGGYGNIYKGLLGDTEVAIKVLDPDGEQGFLEFRQELDAFIYLRHQNLVTFVGACLESRALICLYIHGGSLEDRLTCKDNSPPLQWQTRMQIATELCSVVVFLHSNPYCSIIHGDLKPAKILLDENFVCKLSDFGLCHMSSETGENFTFLDTSFVSTVPRGTFGYLDPEFLITGRLSEKSDVYSIGIILLRLLTGLPEISIQYKVRNAWASDNNVTSILDPLAGDWPSFHAIEVARMALRCCDVIQSSRPNLDDVLTFLKLIKDQIRMTTFVQNHHRELVSHLSVDVEGSQQNKVRSLPKVNTDRPIGATVKKILAAFRNKSRRICLYGRGGSGKSIVLKTLSHHPAPKQLFDQIVFVSIPRFDRRRKMQSQIAQQLSLNIEESNSKDEIAAQICKALTSRRRKVLLLLDDVWETMNLEEVGIPTGSNDSCWLVFTTRYLDVSTDMATREIEMEVLSTVEALELLRYHVGVIADSPEFEPCARDIAEECHGLPLIIIVVASSLKMESSVMEWKLALSLFSDSSNSSNLFHSSPHIKYCYDRLKDDDAKTCFLYCALFASDKEIDISVLVDCFFAEGLLGARTSAAYNKGHNIVGHLVNASLLEATSDGCKVKMHNVIRDSALEILSSSTKGYRFLTGSYLRVSTVPNSVMLSPNIDKYFTGAYAQLKGSLPLEEWAHAEMICLMDNGISKLPCKPSCPTLEALFLQRNNCLRVIPTSFFDSMDALKILNLSKTRIKCLVDSFSKLKSLKVLVLRDCEQLFMLPSSIGCLKSLEVLDLEGTELTHLPESVGELANLKQLRVSFYGSIYHRECSKLPTELIPEGVISRLTDLRELGLFVSPGDQRWESGVTSIIEEISSLKLSALYFYFPDEIHLDHFLRGNTSWKHGNLSTFNFIVGHDYKHALPQVSYDAEMMHNGEEKCARFVNGENMPLAVLEVLSLVTSFYLDHHLNICNLSDSGIHIIETLKICILRDCPQIQEIVDSKKCSDFVFPILECLSINYAWNLEKIWVGQVIPGSFARLRYMSLQSCPKLRYVLTFSMLDLLHNLEELMIEDCESLEYIVIQDEVAVDDATSAVVLEKPCVSEISDIISGTVVMRCLKVLKLHTLPNLCSIWKGGWPALEYISFYDCPLLKNLRMDKKRCYEHQRNSSRYGLVG